MQMKKFINDPENLTAELLEGLALANPDILELGEDNMVINKKLAEADRVTIVTQGGSGHEPAIEGFVGEGMVDIDVVGDIFAAPGPQACVDAIKLADKGKGVLYIVLPHVQDRRRSGRRGQKPRGGCRRRAALRRQHGHLGRGRARRHASADGHASGRARR